MTHQTKKNRASMSSFTLSLALMLQTSVAMEHDYSYEKAIVDEKSYEQNFILKHQDENSSALTCCLDNTSDEIIFPIEDIKIPYLLSEDVLFDIENTCHLFLTPEAGEALNNFFTNFAYEKSLELYLIHGIHLLKPLTQEIHTKIEIFCNKIEKPIQELLKFGSENRKNRRNHSSDELTAENAQLAQIKQNFLQNFVSSCSQSIVDSATRNVNHYLDRLSGEVIGPKLIAPLFAKAIHELKIGTLLQNLFFKNLCEYNSSFKPAFIKKNTEEQNALLKQKNEAIEKLESLKSENLPDPKTKEEQEFEDKLNEQISGLKNQAYEKLGRLKYYVPYSIREKTEEEKEVDLIENGSLKTLKDEVSARESIRNMNQQGIRRTEYRIERSQKEADKTLILIDKIQNYKPCPLNKEQIHKDIKHYLSFIMTDSHKRRLTLCKTIIQDLHGEISALTTIADEAKKPFLDILENARQELNEEDENHIDSNKYHDLAEHSIMLSTHIALSGKTSHLKKMEASDFLEQFMEILYHNLKIQHLTNSINNKHDLPLVDSSDGLVLRLGQISYNTLDLYRNQEIIGKYMQPCPHIIPGKTLLFLMENVYPKVSWCTYKYLTYFKVLDNLEQLKNTFSPEAFQETYDDTLNTWNGNEENYSYINLIGPTLGHLIEIKIESDNLTNSLHRATLPIKAALSAVPPTLLIGSLYFITGDFATALLCLPDSYTNGFYGWLGDKMGNIKNSLSL